VLPHVAIDAVAVVPRGAHPSYAHGYYDRDNAFYEAWDPVSRDRECFRVWMERHVIGTEDFDEYLESVREEGAIEV
jgi:glutaconate CoA-transferase, subunit A